MRWSELPQNYKDLVDTFDEYLKNSIDEDQDDLSQRFRWNATPENQGWKFWCACYHANTVDRLPPIPKS